MIHIRRGRRVTSRLLTHGRTTSALLRPSPLGTQVLVIAWHLLAGECDDADLGGDFFARRDSDRARQRAVAQLQALGYQVTLQPLAA
jgi:hypothetical protein